MITLKKTTLAAVCATMFMASTAMANETYTCTHGAQERQISVEYTNEGSPVPCQVTYTKDTGTETLWNADNLAGYCEEQAAAFVEKQRSWGWTCEKQESMKEEAQETM